MKNIIPVLSDYGTVLLNHKYYIKMKTTVKAPRSKREEKKQVSISWNSRLFFQIGIIVSCLLVLFVMQTSFKMDKPSYPKHLSFGLEEPPLIDYQIDIEKPKHLASVRRDVVKPISVPKRVRTDVFIVKSNTSEALETSISPTDITFVEPSGQDNSEPIVLEPTEPSNILNVEFVPVYPGCEDLGSNAEKIDCLSDKISIFINRNFRKEILEDLERNQVQKIYVQFRIDSQGFIKDVRANSRNEKLKKEAQRVVSNLPKMRPGRQGDKNVEVLYTVPIIFQLH